MAWRRRAAAARLQGGVLLGALALACVGAPPRDAQALGGLGRARRLVAPAQLRGLAALGPRCLHLRLRAAPAPVGPPRARCAGLARQGALRSERRARTRARSGRSRSARARPRPSRAAHRTASASSQPTSAGGPGGVGGPRREASTARLGSQAACARARPAAARQEASARWVHSRGKPPHLRLPTACQSLRLVKLLGLRLGDAELRLPRKALAGAVAVPHAPRWQAMRTGGPYACPASGQRAVQRPGGYRRGHAARTAAPLRLSRRSMFCG